MRESKVWRVWGTCIAILFAVGGCGSVDDGPDGRDDPNRCASFNEEYGSEIESDTTVTAGRCLRVEETVSVRGDVRITFEPGVRMYFAEKTSLYAAGVEFIVDGEQGDEVIFSGTEERQGWWSGIVLHATDRAANRIEHAVIEYAGHETGVLGTSGHCLYCEHHPSNLQLTGHRGPVRVAIRDTVIRESGAAGLYADVQASMTAFENNKLANNSGPSANIHPRNIGMLDASSTFASEVEVQGGTIEDGSEHVWPSLDAPYWVSGDILVKGEDTRIDIAAGGTYLFEEQKYFAFRDGVLSINGEADAKVTFSGTEELEGWWSGITLHDTDRVANKIEHAVIEYGGNDNGPLGEAMCLYCKHHPSNLQLTGHRGPVQVALTEVELNGSSGFGLFADDGVRFRGCGGLLFDLNGTDWGSSSEEGEGNLRDSCSL